MDTRVKAIRDDNVVGRGSCTSIDECRDDEELVKTLDENNITTARQAVKWAREDEKMWLEHGLECRWGDDDDSQLLIYNEYVATLDSNPIVC